PLLLTVSSVRLTSLLFRLLLPFLFSLLPPPLRSTLFPYTTLFRSKHKNRRIACATVVLQPSVHRRYLDTVALHMRAPVGTQKCQDRKSTRLNSSHVSISYAVFCLKKKKKKTISKEAQHHSKTEELK